MSLHAASVCSTGLLIDLSSELEEFPQLFMHLQDLIISITDAADTAHGHLSVFAFMLYSSCFKLLSVSRGIVLDPSTYSDENNNESEKEGYEKTDGE